MIRASRARRLRVKAQREYFALGKDFLERGIKNNPDRPQLYDALARLYRDKYHDHEHAALLALAAQRPGAPSYEKRFAAYELSYCEGRENEAYERLHELYLAGENERLPTLITRLKYLETKAQHSTPATHSRPSTPTTHQGMRFAIFSDIHANLEATEAVLEDAQKQNCTHFVCLGDVVGYNANPHECVEIVRELDCPVVKGNHDEQASLSSLHAVLMSWPNMRSTGRAKI